MVNAGIKCNAQQVDQIRKNIVNILKVIDFTIDIETNTKVEDVLEITLKLNHSKHLEFIYHKLLISYRKQ